MEHGAKYTHGIPPRVGRTLDCSRLGDQVGFTKDKSGAPKSICGAGVTAGVTQLWTHIDHLSIAFDGQIDFNPVAEPVGVPVPLQCKIELRLKWSWGLVFVHVAFGVVGQVNIGTIICRQTQEDMDRVSKLTMITNTMYTYQFMVSANRATPPRSQRLWRATAAIDFAVAVACLRGGAPEAV